MSETQIRNAIWEMLCDYSAQEIKDAFEIIDINSLIDEVENDFNEEN
jgi:hypothetical protein